jgi:WD40 repeat protein
MLELEPREGVGDVTCLAYAPDGRTLASGHLSGRICRWDLRRGTLIVELTVETAVPCALAFTPDGRRLAVGAWGGCVLYDIARDDSRLFSHGRGGKCSLAFSPDGRTLYFGGSLDEEIVGWDTASGEVRVRLTGNGEGIFVLAHAPYVAELAAGGAGGWVNVWNVTDGHLDLDMHPTSTGSVHALAYSPDGSFLASGGKDRRVTIWDAATSYSLGVLEGHTGTVWALAFADEGRSLLSGAADGTIRVWDPFSGRLQRALDWQFGDVRQMAIAPDGMTAAVSGFGPSIVIWDLD